MSRSSLHAFISCFQRQQGGKLIEKYFLSDLSDPLYKLENCVKTSRIVKKPEGGRAWGTEGSLVHYTAEILKKGAVRNRGKTSGFTVAPGAVETKFTIIEALKSRTSLWSSHSLKPELKELMYSLHHFPECGRSRSVSFHCVWSTETLWLLWCVWVETVSCESERRQRQGFPPWSRINSTHIGSCRGRSSRCRSPPETGVGRAPNGSILEKLCTHPPDEWVICLVSGNVEETFLNLCEEKRREVMEGIQIIYTMHNLHISHE